MSVSTHDRGSKQESSSNRCFQCFRPQRLCYCAAIPQVFNRTRVLILQHRRERFHPFNTARIVRQALNDCELLVGHNCDLANQFEQHPLGEHVGLLYPGDDAPLLSELAPSEQPDQLVVPDGTWHHVKTLMRDIPRLQTLRRVRLAPTSPGRYRIRREPHLHALSTLEATVAALQTLEPDTAGLDRLTHVFERMIGDQLASSSKSQWRQNQSRRRGTTNVPRILTGDLSKVVVAYGEREQGNRHRRDCPTRPAPVFWTAVRLVSGEKFQCAIDSDSIRDPQFMRHLRLSEQVAAAAVSVHEFRERWQEFLRADDCLAIHHKKTAELLEHIEAKFSPTVILKSINLKNDVMPQRIRANPCDSRAAERLAAAVALVEYLHRRYARHSSQSLSSG